MHGRVTCMFEISCHEGAVDGSDTEILAVRRDVEFRSLGTKACSSRLVFRPHFNAIRTDS
jgi:hypothetical protein